MARFDDAGQPIGASAEFDIDVAVERDRRVRVGDDFAVRGLHHDVVFEGLAEPEIVLGRVDGIGGDARRRVADAEELLEEAVGVERPLQEFLRREYVVDDGLVGLAVDLPAHVQRVRVLSGRDVGRVDRQLERARGRLHRGAVDRVGGRGSGERHREQGEQSTHGSHPPFARCGGVLGAARVS